MRNFLRPLCFLFAGILPLSAQSGPDAEKRASTGRIAWFACLAMPVMYEFYHPERKEWKILTASTVVLRPTRREISVFNNGTRLGDIKKHKILFPVSTASP